MLFKALLKSHLRLLYGNRLEPGDVGSGVRLLFLPVPSVDGPLPARFSAPPAPIRLSPAAVLIRAGLRWSVTASYPQTDRYRRRHSRGQIRGLTDSGRQRAATSAPARVWPRAGRHFLLARVPASWQLTWRERARAAHSQLCN